MSLNHLLNFSKYDSTAYTVFQLKTSLLTFGDNVVNSRLICKKIVS